MDRGGPGQGQRHPAHRPRARGGAGQGDPGRRHGDGAAHRAAGRRAAGAGRRDRAGRRRGPQAGITFPTDPGGGSGDEAYIRYWPYGGENTILRIANNNDPDDLIAFTQYGADRLRIGGGMLHLGSMEGAAVTAGQVVTALGFWGPGVQHAQLSFRAAGDSS
ncbi:hypothetical protein [Micromonospora sp. ATA51]|uniref:hypothetical protein n=1 Tax=Micromonospora sp. ATA51 TaxID=2806098 RepID=UPI001A47922C|nr:hypothetical protein [Micromonospora sp. ATA51]MBM0227717.1 hypothetical protein [Micromonospora sp. ATA51]